MAALGGPAWCFYLLVLASIVSGQDNLSSKYTAGVKEDSNATQFSFKDICDQVPNDILKCSRKQGLSVLNCNCVSM